VKLRKIESNITDPVNLLSKVINAIKVYVYQILYEDSFKNFTVENIFSILRKCLLIYSLKIMSLEISARNTKNENNK
jgi:hypothetical protein